MAHETGRTVSILLWIGVLFGVLAGAALLVGAIFGGTPQAAASACACAVLPYASAHAFDKIRGR